MASKDEKRAELEAQLAALDDADDESDEVSVTFPDGKTFSGAFRRVKQVAEANGFKLFPDPPADDKSKSDGGNVKRFSGRRVS